MRTNTRLHGTLSDVNTVTSNFNSADENLLTRRGTCCKERMYNHEINKRAQRALGRSPEENVKGHSGANNREPQGHNLNNFGRGPFDDVIY